MKKKIVFSICALIILTMLGVAGYYFNTGKSCRISKQVCLTSRKIIVHISKPIIKTNGEVKFGVQIIDNAGEYLKEEKRIFHEQWNFGDELQQPIQEAYADGALPHSQAGYEKKYIYTKPGRYTVSMKTLDNQNNILYTSNTITFTLPESSFDSVSQEIPKKRDTLFFATHTKKELSIYTLNPATQTTPAVRTIPFADYVTSRSTRYASGTNDAIQYNPKTQDIFILTQGKGDSGRSRCLNADKTCTSRIYTLSAKSSTPIMLYESEETPTHWVVNSFDNSIILDFVTSTKQTVQKLNAQDGSVIFNKEYTIPENTELAQFVVGKDGKTIYQSAIESRHGEITENILRLRLLNSATGELYETEIYRGYAIETETAISPDNRWIAFYLHAYDEPLLLLYALQPQEEMQIPVKPTVQPEDTSVGISNMNLSWSSDSQRLFYMQEDGLAYFDTETRINSFITTSKTKEETPFVLSASGAESDKYVLYIDSQKRKIILYNTITKQYTETTLPLVQNAEPVVIDGVTWY